MPYQQGYLPGTFYDESAFPMYAQAHINQGNGNGQNYPSQLGNTAFQSTLPHGQSSYQIPPNDSHLAYAFSNYYPQQQQQNFQVPQPSPVQFQQSYAQSFDSSTPAQAGFGAPLQFHPDQSRYYQQPPLRQQLQQHQPVISPVQYQQPQQQQPQQQPQLPLDPQRRASHVQSNSPDLYAINQSIGQAQWTDASPTTYFQAPQYEAPAFHVPSPIQNTQIQPDPPSRPQAPPNRRQSQPQTFGTGPQGSPVQTSMPEPRRDSDVMPSRPTNQPQQAQAARVLKANNAFPRQSQQIGNGSEHVSEHRISNFTPVRLEVPVQRISSSSSTTLKTPHKRRKSNDGQPIPIKNENSPGYAIIKQNDHIPTSSPLTSLPSSQLPPPPTPVSLDYQAVLLGLSDEYISAAYSMNTSLEAGEVSEDHLNMYHDLLATGMGCLDSVLKNYRIPDARLEGRIRLRLANLMYEETENLDDAMEVLSKGINVCERSRLHDLKYAMSHLLVRVTFQSGKAKAAFKLIDRYTNETEQLNFIHWTYAFRFLAVSLGLQMGPSHASNSSMLRQLAAIHTFASERNHVKTQIVARTIEALIHLRSRYPDSIEQTQRCLAKARAYQLSPEMQNMSQIRALQQCLDLACSLARFNAEDAKTKMRIMHAEMDSANRDASWSADGRWLVAIGETTAPSGEIINDTCGLMQILPNGQIALAFRWLTRIQVYELGYLLSGLVYMHGHTSDDEQKARDSLSEGLKTCHLLTERPSQSLPVAMALSDSCHRMTTNLNLYLIFERCRQSDWASAVEQIATLRNELHNPISDTASTTHTLLTYLEAICKQGLGDLQSALELYNTPQLRLASETDVKPSAYALLEIQVLSILNKALIIRSPDFMHRISNPNESVERLLARVEPFCIVSASKDGVMRSNKALEAVYHIIKSTSGSKQEMSENSIIRTKQHLQLAVQAAKSSMNNQLLCIVMNNIADQFFKNIVGNQAVQSVKAGRKFAKDNRDDLWLAVADRMYADTLERSGKAREAGMVRSEGQTSMQKLPESLQAVFANMPEE